MPLIPRSDMDVLIGQRIRQPRDDWAISSGQLADATGLSIGELRACETGEGNITANLLYEIAYHLQMPVGYFFEGL